MLEMIGLRILRSEEFLGDLQVLTKLDLTLVQGPDKFRTQEIFS